MDNNKKLYGRIEAAQMLSISVRKLDELIVTKQIASLKIGKRRLVSEQSISRFIRRAETSAR